MEQQSDLLAEQHAETGNERLGVLICGHGSRNRLAVEEFAQMVDALRPRLAPMPVEHGYLEFARPILRDGLDSLREKGVPSVVYYPTPIHQQPAYLSYPATPMPNTQRLCQTVMSLPMHPYLEENDQEQLIEAVLEASHTYIFLALFISPSSEVVILFFSIFSSGIVEP